MIFIHPRLFLSAEEDIAKVRRVCVSRKKKKRKSPFVVTINRMREVNPAPCLQMLNKRNKMHRVY